MYSFAYVKIFLLTFLIMCVFECFKRNLVVELLARQGFLCNAWLTFRPRSKSIILLRPLVDWMCITSPVCFLTVTQENLDRSNIDICQA